MLRTDHLRDLASDAGLDEVGVAVVGPTPTWDTYRAWIAQDYAGEMTYLARFDAVDRRADPQRVLPEARTVLVVAASYGRASLPDLPPLHGRIARYAWGEDYHRQLLFRLETLVQRIVDVTGPFPHRCYVDTGPILERAWAQTAGLGWIGKNTCLIHPQLGSFTFLGVALLGIDLEPTPARDTPVCGTCTRCLDACPTGALVAPGVLDARRCLAYLTIEHRGTIPENLRPHIGDRVFGCDTCQEVCPWNRKPLQAHADIPTSAVATLDLPSLLLMDEVEFRARFRHKSIWRATWRGLARNAAIVLGNRGDPASEPTLAEAAAHHPDALVREHASWAIAQLGRS